MCCYLGAIFFFIYEWIIFIPPGPHLVRVSMGSLKSMYICAHACMHSCMCTCTHTRNGDGDIFMLSLQTHIENSSGPVVG